MALDSGSEPVFFNNPFLEPFVPYPDQKLWSIRKRADATRSGCNTENFLNKIDDDLGAAWRAMQSFCSLINLAAETQRMIPPEVSEDTMASAMYRLLRTGFETGSIDEAIRLGLLCLSYHIFLQWQDMKLSHVHFPSAYKNCLVNLKLVDRFPSRIMLWLLMIGGISMFTTSDDTWLKDALRKHIEIYQAKP